MSDLTRMPFGMAAQQDLSRFRMKMLRSAMKPFRADGQRWLIREVYASMTIARFYRAHREVKKEALSKRNKEDMLKEAREVVQRAKDTGQLDSNVAVDYTVIQDRMSVVVNAKSGQVMEVNRSRLTVVNDNGMSKEVDTAAIGMMGPAATAAAAAKFRRRAKVQPIGTDANVSPSGARRKLKPLPTASLRQSPPGTKSNDTVMLEITTPTMPNMIPSEQFVEDDAGGAAFAPSQRSVPDISNLVSRSGSSFDAISREADKLRLEAQQGRTQPRLPAALEGLAESRPGVVVDSSREALAKPPEAPTKKKIRPLPRR